ncbi:hypothetical protein B0T14DRAFT_522380 [Immersiella caudata]|uniref:Uncharacterized protein n=1 Tax=Immersiella caudata TaxID=314043 RepID=A0AA40C1B1_9PEZI|nr:hypothetical protein B0T14DRAFT_522380 [Immersiella caudata]
MSTPQLRAGKSWVDFIRAIQAITLFGEGFGDLFTPIQTAASCTRWNTVPEGNAASNSMMLAPGIYWTPAPTPSTAATAPPRARGGASEQATSTRTDASGQTEEQSGWGLREMWRSPRKRRRIRR